MFDTLARPLRIYFVVGREPVVRPHLRKKQEKEEKDENFHRLERTYGSFSRMVELPGEVNPEEIDATHKKGVLKLVLKKTRETEAKKIEIKTG